MDFTSIISDIRERNEWMVSALTNRRKLAALLRRLDALVAEADAMPEPRQWWNDELRAAIKEAREP